MKFLVASLIALTSLNTLAGTSMKVEGQCFGTLNDGSAVNLTYYSSFNGCSKKSTAAVQVAEGPHASGLITGERTLGKEDVYSFKVSEGRSTKEYVRLTFANSTGNTEGKFRFYKPENGKYYVMTLSCNIRDYSYSDC